MLAIKTLCHPAFSRKQVLDAKPVDLHEVLTESEFMLPRLLGSDVQQTFAHRAARSWLLADPSQLEQVIANLAINARDALPFGGNLTISTSNFSRLPASTRASLPRNRAARLARPRSYRHR